MTDSSSSSSSLSAESLDFTKILTISLSSVHRIAPISDGTCVFERVGVNIWRSVFERYDYKILETRECDNNDIRRKKFEDIPRTLNTFSSAFFDS